MAKKYEALMLSMPEITSDEAKNLEMQLDKIVRAGKGTTVSFERWGKYRLAYDVNKNEYGVYFLMRFDVPKGTNLVQDLKTAFKVKFNNIVMRDMISVLDPKQPLTYQRPRSLEEAPAREEGFLKEGRSSAFFASADEREDIDVE